MTNFEGTPAKTPTQVDSNTEKVDTHPSPRRNSWKHMNAIQKTGVIGSLALYAVAIPLSGSHLGAAIIVGVCGWSFLLFGYVVGALWKVRHALHFWYSMAFACAVHACLLPLYSRFARGMFLPSSAAKAYIYLSALLVCAETIVLLLVLKRVALRLHGKQAKPDKGPLAGYDYGK